MKLFIPPLHTIDEHLQVLFNILVMMHIKNMLPNKEEI